MANPIRRNLSSSQVSDWFTGKSTITIPSRRGKMVATGGTITTDSTYRYHTFTGLGTFTISTSGFIDALVISGGGTSGNAGSGGGAGGVLTFTNQLIQPATYTVMIGAGGYQQLHKRQVLVETHLPFLG